MSKKSGISNADIKRLNKRIYKDAKSHFSQAINETKVLANCPNCNQEIEVAKGLNVCPHCGNEFNVDFSFREFDV